MDSSASQQKLLLAVLLQLNAGDDPNGESAMLESIDDVPTVKTFLVVAMAAHIKHGQRRQCWMLELMQSVML